MCGFATDERKRIEMVQQVSKCDPYNVAIKESWEREGAGIGCKVEAFTWIGNKREGQNPKSKRATGVGFLVLRCRREITEVIHDAKFCYSIWIGIPGQQGMKDFSVGVIYKPPQSKK